MPKNNSVCFCGKGFYASPGHKILGWGKFCSFACRDKYKSENLPVTKCVTCGGEFHRKKHYTDNHTALYCSIKCKKEKEKSLSVKCDNCGKYFNKHKAHLKRTKKNFCSRECFGMALSKSRFFYGNKNRGVAGGKREDLNNKYFRSSWEANYARYLNWLISLGEIKAWYFEPDTFHFVEVKRGNIFYIPDFKIINNDGSHEYHEVKGYMDDRSAVKLKRMAKYFPNEKVILIGKEEYQALSRQLKNMLPNWEVSEKHSLVCVSVPLT